MSRNRAYRRHQFRRAKKRAIRMLKTWDRNSDNNEWKYSESEGHIHLYAKNRCPCSCWMCRGERYHRQWESQDPLKEAVEDYERM